MEEEAGCRSRQLTEKVLEIQEHINAMTDEELRQGGPSSSAAGQASQFGGSSNGSGGGGGPKAENSKFNFANALSKYQEDLRVGMLEMPRSAATARLTKGLMPSLAASGASAGSLRSPRGSITPEMSRESLSLERDLKEFSWEGSPPYKHWLTNTNAVRSGGLGAWPKRSLGQAAGGGVSPAGGNPLAPLANGLSSDLRPSTQSSSVGGSAGFRTVGEDVHMSGSHPASPPAQKMQQLLLGSASAADWLVTSQHKTLPEDFGKQVDPGYGYYPALYRTAPQEANPRLRDSEAQVSSAFVSGG